MFEEIIKEESCTVVHTAQISEEDEQLVAQGGIGLDDVDDGVDLISKGNIQEEEEEEEEGNCRLWYNSLKEIKYCLQREE